MIHPYLWIVVISGVICFFVACGNGAQDLSNAFGTSYGSRVLTLLQIIIIATCCEFAGAVGLGSSVATTMSSGIAKSSLFKDDPYVLMYGFLCALGATFIWLVLATWKDLPVSSHHSVAGGIIGFALVFGGGNGVIWAGPKDTFPFVSGVVPIIVSWFISPLLSGIVAIIFYCAIRFSFLQWSYAVRVAPYTLPVVVLVTVFLEFLFIFMIAAKSKLSWTIGHSAWMAAVVGVGAGVLSIGLVPLLQRRIRAIEREAAERVEEEGRPVEAVLRDILTGGRTLKATGNNKHGKSRAAEKTTAAAKVAGGSVESPVQTPIELRDVNVAAGADRTLSFASTGRNKLETGEADGAVVQDEQEESAESASSTDDVARASTVEDDFAREGMRRGSNGVIYDLDGVRLFDPRAEYMFRYLQIFTAACTSLAHGSNDVSNSIGPFAAVYDIYAYESVRTTVEVPVWLLCLGGAGIICGLATFGLKIMRFLGEKLALITPCRGFCAELSTALVVAFASGYGIPVSSTHCITGAVIAISMIDVGVRNVRWYLVLKMYVGWIFTLVITGFMSACFFAQGINSPIGGMSKQ